MEKNLSHNIKVIIHSGAWVTNIGNAFIHFGAKALIKEALPNSIVGFASGMPRWFFRDAMSFSLKRNKFFKKKKTIKHYPTGSVMDNAIDLTGEIDSDLLIITGMTLCEEFIEISGPPLRNATKSGTKVLFLGAGGSKYTNEEKMKVVEFFNEIKPIGLITRDRETYSLYKNEANNTFDGIDCGFFVYKEFSPMRLRIPNYVVSTFDKIPEPKIDLMGRTLIRSHHTCWRPIPTNYVNQESTLISDLPEDYLNLYANADEVHSDRVHACVAALAYGRPARFYNTTPRASLFKSLEIDDINRKLITIEPELILEKQSKQLNYLKKCLENFL